MSGPMGVLDAAWAIVGRSVSWKASTMCRSSGTSSQRMGDKNEQYLLDYRCDCRRSFRAGLSWAALTPELDRRRAWCGVEEMMGGEVPAGAGAPRPGPGAAEALGRKQSLRAPHRGPHLLIFASFTSNRAGDVLGGLRALGALWLQPPGPSGHPRVHWNITVLEPSALVRMFETVRCDPLFMQ
jgi:hypothetical protein